MRPVLRRNSRRHARRAGVLVGAIALLATSVLTVPGAAAQSTEDPSPDGPPTPAVAEQIEQAPGDGVSHSSNIRRLASLPKEPPFDNTAAFNSDIAFQDRYAYVGNYDGFVVYDIRNPRKPRIATQVYCPGGQGDVSVSGDLLYYSVDYPRSNNTCDSEPSNAANPDAWEGIRVFDISKPTRPKYVADVATDCGSHTHTLVPDHEGDADYLYISSYAPSVNFPNCAPPHDKISIVKVPLDDPSATEVVAEPVLFPEGGNPGPPEGARATTGCHDITAYPEKDLAAGACMGDGILLDISDREAPVVIEQVRDDVNFAFWHSATFNNEGTKVVFTDELGGGGAATCNAEIGETRGANGIYDVTGSGTDLSLEFRSYYKIPRHQGATENCVAHNGSLIPTRNGDYMVQAWYQGGVSVWDFTDSANPEEIGYFDREAFDPETLRTAGSWSAYYYNGYIYSSDIQMGLDVLEVKDRRLNDAKRVRYDEFNPQTQPSYRR
ncbi:LVIVD repeat-containing protein [Actinoalloteichus fjordicus]|uniref:LVIVD repeat-containing protein n=1 Tax=Actinoalloteichus fjordicus TaxID=1612552 RepID=A0AAC9PQY3_9PSEU|nr:hypothetical protein UA74_06730 [Actinoalloteichus fjordicus]APU19367.1 hypothetical protein UA75_06730 [Actinoalloteichus sp. GBA129-24]